MNLSISDILQRIQCFHMTSRRPYWFSKTIKRRPCWCAKPTLWELNSFLMKTLSFVPINLHRHRPREWKRWLSIKLNTPHISLCHFWRYIDTSTLIKIICKLSQKLWVIHSVLLNMFLLLRFSGFDLICLNLYTLVCDLKFSLGTINLWCIPFVSCPVSSQLYYDF